MSRWVAGTGAVTSVNAKTGTVVLTATDVGALAAAGDAKGVVLTSPGGTNYRVTVGNDGALTTTAI